MAGMMRFKSDKDFQEMLKRSHLRVHGSVIAPARAPVVKPAAKPEDLTKLSGSELEEAMAIEIELAGLPAPIQQYPHLRGSRHKLDFAWPDRKIGLEVQGMVHRIKRSFKTDIKKRAMGLLQGWRILEVGGAEVRDGTAILWLTELLNGD